MSKTRNLSDLLDANGDVKSGALDNVPASDNASALTSGTLPDARLSSNVTQNGSTQTLTNKTINASNNTLSNIPNSALSNSAITINGSATSLGGSVTVNDASDLTTGTLPDARLSSNITTNDGTQTLTNKTIASSQLTGALPALDGSALTNLSGGVSNVKTVVVTSSSTYTPSTGTKFVTVYATGGGGGAGGLNNTTGSQYGYGSSGAGGSGGTALRTYNATELGSNASVTIGSAGGGGSGDSAGSNGGATSFNPAGTGTTITGNGGVGGKGITVANAPRSGMFGQGGSADNGELTIQGQGGSQNANESFNSDTRNVQANNGGASFWGGHNSTRSASNGNSDHGQSATAFGAGGNGAVSYGSYGTRNGGNGKAGIVVIMEFA